MTYETSDHEIAVSDVVQSFALPRIEPNPSLRHQPFPLTDIQQAYWIGRRGDFELGNIAAHGYMEVDATGIDLDRLDDALQKVIARHDMLRAIVNEDGTQHILAEVSAYRMPRTDLREKTPDEARQSLDKLRAELSHQVLDSARWPLFDFRVSQLSEGKVRLHLSIDVLIFDAQSFDIISGDWKHYYLNPATRLPELSFSYADYVRGLGELARSPLAAQSAEYWRRKLDDLPLAPELPLAVNPALITHPCFQRRSGRLDVSAWANFRTRAAKLGLTPSIALLAAYAKVLARWSAKRRFTLNLTLFNRVPFHSDVNELVGDFTSVVPLAINAEPRRSFADFARSLQSELWDAMDHRHVSGVWVVRELNERRRSTQLLPVVFTSTLRSTANDEPAERAMSWLGTPGYVLTQTPQVWLDHQIEEDAGGLLYDWDAVSELFPEGMLDDMFVGYRALIEALSQDDAAWASHGADLLPPWQHELLGNVNATNGPVPGGLLHDPVLAQCRRTPERMAVIEPDRSVTYSELYISSNRIAHELWRLGSSTGERIGIYLPKGFLQIAAVLGILEAGAVYVPLDPAQPPDRIAALLTAGGIARIITTRPVLLQRPLQQVGSSVFLDELEGRNHQVKPLPATVKPTELAYVIFTSGSTGKPKGVAIDHRGALNTVVDINQRFSVTADDRVLGLSELNFDLSVYDIFGFLAIGGTLVLPSPERQREPAHWDELMRAHGVTVWNTVPALMDIYTTYLESVAKRNDEQLRVVMMSGDWIPVRLPESIRRLAPNSTIYSLGGATEASIWSIYYPITECNAQWRSVPYGKPLLNQTFHVLNDHLDPCPVWATGELFIGGIGLAQCYFGDPARSAASFFSHPRTGERLYRTGDLGRYLPDGNIEFLGRKDFQAKINGYRVELVEIEGLLERSPGVQAAVVTLHGEQNRAKKLVGYYVRAQDDSEAKAVAKLRHRLSDPGIRRFEGNVVSFPLPNGSRTAPLSRRTIRHYRKEPLALPTLNEMLQVLRRHQTEHGVRYHYGSAGSLYPVQVYISVNPDGVNGVDAGLYYYHPVEHSLVRVGQGAGFDTSFVAPENESIWSDCGFQLLMIANLDAIEPIYGESSEQMILLEAGLMTQLLEDAAASAGDLGVCQIGGFDFQRACPQFGFSNRVRYLHCIAGGRPAPKQQAVPARVESAGRDSACFEDKLRIFLKSKLPEYMVPAVLLELDALPLSANGKVDRNALPEPKAQRVSDVAAAPAIKNTELAAVIRSVWSAALGTDEIGLNDGFFDLGGTSVDMIKIHSRLQGQLPKAVPVVDMFFTYPTIATLVEYLDDGSDKETAIALASQRNQLTAAQRQRRRKS